MRRHWDEAHVTTLALRLLVTADGAQAMYSPEAPLLGCKDMPGKPVISHRISSNDLMLVALAWSSGAKGWTRLSALGDHHLAVELSFNARAERDCRTSEMSFSASLKM